MKHIKHILQLFALAIFLLSSCTKEELNIVDEPIEMDENSVEFQTYLAERARKFIKMYRFEKLDGVLEKLTDPAIRQEITTLYKQYKTKAENEALFIVDQNNDSLYFLIPPRYEYIPPAEATSLYMVFDDASYMIDAAGGTLQGFKIYPNLELLQATYPRTAALKDLDGIPKLKTFNWLPNQDNFQSRFPTEEFVPAKLQADFSKNTDLETMTLAYTNITDLVYPEHKLKKLNLQSCIMGENDNLDKVNVTEIAVSGMTTIANSNFILKNNVIDTLNFGGTVTGLKTLDVENSKLLTLHANSSVNASSLEQVKLNDGLRRLALNTRNLKEQLIFPQSLKDMHLNTYTFEPAFSDLNQLETLGLSYATSTDYTGAPNYLTFKANTLQLPTSLKHLELSSAGYYHIDIDGIQLPQSLRSVYCSARIKAGTWDMSNLLNLKEVVLYTTSIPDGTFDLKLPASVEKINFSSSTITVDILDLSQLTNLKYLNTGSLGNDPVTLILPPNLSETVFTIQGPTVKPVSLKTGSTIVNKPAWFDQYVQYF